MTNTTVQQTKPGGLLARAWQGFLSYAIKFGVVGALGFALDVGVFNLLRVGALGTDQWWSTAIGAKVVSSSLAIIFNWLGNRFWTFRHERHTHIAREFVEFVIASLIGMGVSIACLWFTHYVLNFTTLLADNISGNISGLGLGAVVRFVLYRYWVWSPRRAVSGKPS
jgi:putative flippase GtrA